METVYRVYYFRHGLTLLVLLCGGDKRSPSSPPQQVSGRKAKNFLRKAGLVR